MPLSKAQRREQLHRHQALLKSENGQLLMNELALMWDGYKLLGGDAEETAYNVGLRDAFKFLQTLERGELIHE